MKGVKNNFTVALHVCNVPQNNTQALQKSLRKGKKYAENKF